MARILRWLATYTRLLSQFGIKWSFKIPFPSLPLRLSWSQNKVILPSFHASQPENDDWFFSNVISPSIPLAWHSPELQYVCMQILWHWQFGLLQEEFQQLGSCGKLSPEHFRPHHELQKAWHQSEQGEMSGEARRKSTHYYRRMIHQKTPFNMQKLSRFWTWELVAKSKNHYALTSQLTKSFRIWIRFLNHLEIFDEPIPWSIIHRSFPFPNNSLFQFWENLEHCFSLGLWHLWSLHNGSKGNIDDAMWRFLDVLFKVLR